MASYSILDTPLGSLMLVAGQEALTGLYFPDRAHAPAVGSGWVLDPRHPILERTREQLEEYFDGRRTEFSIPLRLAGTAFQQRVWREIALIPFGQTITYGELAARAGAPAAVRAAGLAAGRNPIGIFIPCHRVLGKGGSLTGYAGGLARKRHLLQLESGVKDPSFALAAC